MEVSRPGESHAQSPVPPARSVANGHAADRLFLAVLVAISASYIVLIGAMLIAQFSFTSPQHVLHALRSPEIRFAFWLSMITCTLATLFSLVVGVPLGYLLARLRFPGRAFVNAVVDIPIALPPLVIGLCLLILFQTRPGRFVENAVARFGPHALASVLIPVALGLIFIWTMVRLLRPGSTPVGKSIFAALTLLAAASLFLAARHHAAILAFADFHLGRGITYAVPSIILAQFAVACAFAARTMRAVFEQISPRTESVALTLGCGRASAFWHVTIPEARRGILTAGTIAWARALGEFGPILIFSGATRMRTEVLPTSVFLELSVGNIEAAVAVSMVMIVAAVVVLTVARAFGARDSLIGGGA